METKQYLTFTWHNVQYGIEASQVQEIFSLPEFTIIPEAPTEIIGILNCRGQTVPMIHLDSIQGHPLKNVQIRHPEHPLITHEESSSSLTPHTLTPTPYFQVRYSDLRTQRSHENSFSPTLYFQISDHVLILQWDSLSLGLIVHQVNAVLELNPALIEFEVDDELLGNHNKDLISGIAKEETGNILLLHVPKLISQSDSLLTFIWDLQGHLDAMEAFPTPDISPLLGQDEIQQDEKLKISQNLPSFYDLYCPNATPEEREIFRQRADNLKPSLESSNPTSELIPLAVIGFGNEYFGLNLDLVREFTDMSNLTPIPCCPNHIVGNMNLRGEIVTLVDIRNVLNLPISSIQLGSPAVVVQVDDIVAGFPVDQVLEMVHLNAADIKPLPGILSDFGEQYLQGAAVFEEKMLRVLDLPKLLTKGGLAVNEEA